MKTRWSAGEIDFLLKNREKKTSDLVPLLSARTYASIAQKKTLLNLTNKHLTEDEMDFLAQLFYQDMSTALSRVIMLGRFPWHYTKKYLKRKSGRVKKELTGKLRKQRYWSLAEISELKQLAEYSKLSTIAKKKNTTYSAIWHLLKRFN